MTRSLQHQFDTGTIRSQPPVRFAQARVFADLLAETDRTAKARTSFTSGGGAKTETAPHAFVADCAARLIADDYDADAFRLWLESRASAEVADLMLNVLTLAARELGEMWVEDSCSFADVTIGMHRLTLLLVDLEPPHADPLARAQHGGRVLLAPAPGDQHGFGLAMVGFFLRRAGWDVRADIASEPAAIVAQVARRPYDVVGFSVGHERAITPVFDLIAEVRRRSLNRAVRIVVGGPMLIGRPDRAASMGADLCAEDAAALVSAIAPLAPAYSV